MRAASADTLSASLLSAQLARLVRLAALDQLADLAGEGPVVSKRLVCGPGSLPVFLYLLPDCFLQQTLELGGCPWLSKP